MAFDDSLIKDVLAHADIVDIISRFIDVIPKGKAYIALCPFHDDSTPSMQISREKQIFKCFVCGTGGSAIKFVQEYKRISFMEALKEVADLSGYHDERLNFHTKQVEKDPEKENLIKCINDLTTYYEYALRTNEGQEGYQYFIDRGINDELQKTFRLGYAFNDGKATINYLQSKGNSLKSTELIGIATGSSTIYSDKNAGRIIFPLCDVNGQVVGYSARRIKDDGTAKYINSPETKLFHKSSVLYNFHIAKEEAKRVGYVYVLEGFMDVFALAKIGIKSAVATMGTALTNEHKAMLRSLGCEIRFCLDGDNAGQVAQMRIIEDMRGTNIPYTFVDNTNNTKDPDEILMQDGADALKQRLNNLVSPLDFILNFYRDTKALTTMEDRKKLVAYFLPILADVKSRLELDDYLIKLSKITKFDIESIRKLVDETRNKSKEERQSILVNFQPERKEIKKLGLAEREILYHMLRDERAIQFYENKIESFYDSIYRKIADYILEYYENTSSIDLIGLVASIESKENNENNNLIDEISSISLEENHPQVIDEKYLNDILETINVEKEKIHSKHMLETMLANKKDPLEKARILAEYGKRKMNKGGK